MGTRWSLLVLGLLAGCVWREMPYYEGRLRVGDRVRVTDQEGRRSTFRVTRIDGGTLHGGDLTFRPGDVVTLERREVAAPVRAGVNAARAVASVAMAAAYVVGSALAEVARKSGRLVLR